MSECSKQPGKRLRAGGLVAAVLVAASACRGDEAGDARGRSSPAPHAADPSVASGAAPPEGTRSGEPPAGGPPARPARRSPGVIEVEAPPPGTEERSLLGGTGALPAWGAVHERARLLGRRGQHGAVWGRIAPVGDGTLWLLDETTSSPGLGIRVAGAGSRNLAVTAGQRVVAWGAWSLDGQRRWVWQVDRLVALPGPAPAGTTAPAAGSRAIPLPGHLMTEMSQAPDGAVPPSQRHGPGPVVFVVVAAPVKPGDGWTIADQARGAPTAALLLPGEAPLYGGLDYISPDERWPLAPGAWYVAHVTLAGRPPRTDDLPVLRAQAPPAQIPAPAPPPPPARKQRPRRSG